MLAHHLKRTVSPELRGEKPVAAYLERLGEIARDDGLGAIFDSTVWAQRAAIIAAPSPASL